MAAAPVLVKSYKNDTRRPPRASVVQVSTVKALPPISSFAFADILRNADCPDLRTAIDGIAEICAKNSMSLADEYASHLPPAGEITAASSLSLRPHPGRLPKSRALTSVPEASSSGSEGSTRKRKASRSGLFRFMRPQEEHSPPRRRMRIGSTGMTVPVGSTTALAIDDEFLRELEVVARDTDTTNRPPSRPQSRQRRTSEAASSLRQILNRTRIPDPD